MGYDPNFPPDLLIKPLAQGADWGQVFSPASQAAAIEKYGIAGRVWEAAHTLLAYIDPAPGWDFEPPFHSHRRYSKIRAIELGSGTGIVGSQIAKFLRLRDEDALVVVTDLPEVCPLLEQNLKEDYDVVRVRPLSWGNEEDAQQIQDELENPLSDIICSDLVYFPELFAPLLRTLFHLTNTLSPRITISYKIRSLPKEIPFWATFGLYFAFEPVLCRSPSDPLVWERFGGSFEDTTFVFVAHRRPESRQWTVPIRDQDLLDGIGARGSDVRKGDETFELLLLMTMSD